MSLIPPALFFSLKIAFATQGLLCLHTNSEIFVVFVLYNCVFSKILFIYLFGWIGS